MKFGWLRKGGKKMRKGSLSVPSCLLFGAVMFVASPASAGIPTCSDLGTNAGWGLAGNSQLSALAWQIVPAAGATPAYCRLDFTYSVLSGPAAGYDTGQSQQIKIRVGLPLNTADGGS